jgi:ribosome recycling factor
MVKELITKKVAGFENAVEHFASEAAKIRTGRANPGLVENIMVDYYGVKTPLKQIASVNIPEARQILIQPWDKGMLVFVEAALRESDLGVNPSNDGQNIRLTLPPLTEDRRKDFVKTLNHRAEDGRIAIRTIREEIWKEIQELERTGAIAEDDKFHGKDELQKVVDEYNQKLEAIREKKENEILTV